ncbi:APC family permease [Holzapfeliella sp. He02]|uniref:APC family permease n=1 Tax=Holzapfeliella saturejae TaxID=3082953 RepID=A0ABU8SH06_9LACO
MGKSEQKEKNKLGFWSIVLIGINGIIGSGIYLIPNSAYGKVGTLSLLTFLLAAILVLTVALSIAQNASLFKEDGGPYLYAKEAFGDFVGYIVGLLNCMLQITILATIISGLVKILGGSLSFLSGELTQKILTIAIFAVLAIINLSGVTLAKYINNIMTIAKLLPLVLFIVIGVFFINQGNYTPIVPTQGISFDSFSQAILLIYFAFGGFESLPLIAADMKNPKRNLPRALVTIIALVSAFYILLQAVSIGILGTELAQNTVPVQAAFGRILGPIGSGIVAVGSVVSMAGAAMAVAFWAPRPVGAMAQNDMLPKVLAKKNSKNVPAVAIIVTYALSMLLSLSGGFEILSQLTSVISLVIFLPTTLSVMVFHFTKKDVERPVNIKGSLYIAGFATILIVILLTQTSAVQLMSAGAAIVFSAIMYFITQKSRKKA